MHQATRNCATGTKAATNQSPESRKDLRLVGPPVALGFADQQTKKRAGDHTRQKSLAGPTGRWIGLSLVTHARLPKSQRGGMKTGSGKDLQPAKQINRLREPVVYTAELVTIFRSSELCVPPITKRFMAHPDPRP
jgi:hypothetical protein